MATRCDYCLKHLAFVEFFRSLFGTRRCEMCRYVLSHQLEGLHAHTHALYEKRAIDHSEYMKLYSTLVRIPFDVSTFLIRDLKRWFYICQVHHGDLLTICTRLRVSSDEQAYLEMPCDLRVPARKRPITGMLIITDKNMYFLSKTHRDTFTIAVRTVLSLHILVSTVSVLTKELQTYVFLVADPELVAAFIHAVVQRARRSNHG